MADETNGGGTRGALSVHAQGSVSGNSTHESDAGDGAPAGRLAEDVLKKGDALGRYLVLEQLGAGAMGVVYAAYDPELDRKIAIKILRPQEGKGDRTRRRERLVREAKAMAKLSHPNVGAIYDVGVHGDQVFLAMEFLSGGTLRDWVKAKKRPWREIVKMFIEVGKGLAGAHAEGLIHRDFKPDNVLIDKNGVPKVVDFGLVRLTSGALDRSTTGSMDAVAHDGSAGDEAASLPVAETALAALTRTGALTGTPAYMAPEQFLGKDIDARTDQFAFCIALYEALYGERPFAGETIISLADSVTSERIRPVPKSSDVPTWVRRSLFHGLRVDPNQRFPGFNELLDTLATDPVARIRRRLFVVVGSAAAIAGVIAIRQTIVSKRLEIEKQVREHIGAADTALVEAETKRSEARSLRVRAFAAFDGFAREKGEELWSQGLTATRVADAGYQQGIQHLEAAIALAPRSELRARVAGAIVDYIQMDGRSSLEREAGLRQLAPYDAGGSLRQRLSAPATLHIETTPAQFPARLESYDPLTFQLSAPAKQLGRTPLDLTLAPGSYRVTFDSTQMHVGFRFPVVIAAGEHKMVALPVPAQSAVPDGFAYIPEGQFLFGSGNEDLRSGFLETTPIHPITTRSFLISRNETTVADWIAYLESLPSDQRKRRLPRGSAEASSGFVELRGGKDQGGAWEYVLRSTDTTYRAKENEPFTYRGRTRRASQSWRRFPISGITADDAIAYCSWLDRSGRVPGARLCTESEWERAARGADSREFPHGNDLGSDDANFDITYGRKSAAYGPDEVGSHPASDSPFGIHDLVGNVWEVTRSTLDRGGLVVRGGSFYQVKPVQRSTNRQPIAPATRDHTVGLRVCADVSF